LEIVGKETLLHTLLLSAAVSFGANDHAAVATAAHAAAVSKVDLLLFYGNEKHLKEHKSHLNTTHVAGQTDRSKVQNLQLPTILGFYLRTASRAEQAELLLDHIS